MATASKERRGRKRGRSIAPLLCKLHGRDRAGHAVEVAAAIIDSSHEGLGVEASSPLFPDDFFRLELSQEAVSAGIRTDPWVRVCWSQTGHDGAYKIGLEYAAAPHDHYHVSQDDFEPGLDLYEVLQLNPKADPDTIHRVYRLMAQRFHPDNKDTGDEEEFKRITRAYEILGDPGRRASYDAQFSDARERQWKIFHSAEGARGLPSEKPKRFAILHALYLKRVRDPHAPTLGVFELEDLLAVPREHLEFALWYLKERGFILRGDNNRYQITIAGVDHAEFLAAEDERLEPQQRLLPSASFAG